MVDKDVYDLSILPEGCTVIMSKWITNVNEDLNDKLDSLKQH